MGSLNSLLIPFWHPWFVLFYTLIDSFQMSIRTDFLHLWSVKGEGSVCLAAFSTIHETRKLNRHKEWPRNSGFWNDRIWGTTKVTSLIPWRRTEITQCNERVQPWKEGIEVERNSRENEETTAWRKCSRERRWEEPQGQMSQDSVPLVERSARCMLK